MEQMDLDQEKLDALFIEVQKAGQYAYSQQGAVKRTFKSDGSVLTNVDMAISHKLIAKIEELFPFASVISEEEDAKTIRDAEWTFILDPIDGTDVYSQGLPCFAVSLGVLDSNRNPVGAYIAAPRFGVATEEMLIRLDPGKKATINGSEIVLTGDKDQISEITTGSKAFRLLDFSHFYGKVRVFGSSIIHMLAPVVFSSIEASVTVSCYAWDIASSHAVIKSLGMDAVFPDGTPLVYDDDFIIRKSLLKRPLYCGTEKTRDELRDVLPPLQR